jgi:uncharacterized protein (TIGR02145 family)
MSSQRKTAGLFRSIPLYLLAIMGLSLPTCKKFEAERLIILKEGAVTGVTYTSCVVSATLFDVGGGDGVDQHGFCWSHTLDQNEAIGCTQNGKKGTRGEFSGEVTGLTPGTRYYVWAYASRGDLTVNAKPQSFDTPPTTQPSLTTGEVGDIADRSAHCEGAILSNGGAEITSQGICWNRSSGPTVDHSHVEDSTGLPEFGVDMTGLEPLTTYYVRAFAINSAGIGYGNEQSFTTKAELFPPQVTTNPVEEITWHSAVGGGNVTSDGGTEVFERGLCWSLSSNPTIEDYAKSSGSGTGEFNVQMDELLPNTQYYVRAYVINSVDMTYGNEVVFSTDPEPIAPEVVTSEVEGVGTASATCGGHINNDGGAPIVSKGLCWSLEFNPTLESETLEYGNGPEPFTMEFHGLTHDTEYYVRAYATNSEGLTGYGENKVFRTRFACGSVLVDPRDFKEYPTVAIGEQCWTAKNLDAGVMIDTSDIQDETNGVIEKYCYDNDPGNCDTYGGLYTWYEMRQNNFGETPQGVCPDRWHVPSDGEWKELEAFLGVQTDSLDMVGFRGVGVGGKLKSSDPLWDDPNAGATNETLFSALPAGWIAHNRTSSNLGYFILFWTSTESDEGAIWRVLTATDSRIGRYVDGYQFNTTSVRCVKD